MPNTADPKIARARRGCFFYGFVAFLMLVLLVLAGSYIGYRVFKKTVREYTAAAPMAMPELQVSAAQKERVREQIVSFRDTVRANKPAEPLKLDLQELNTALLDSPEFAPLKDNLRITRLDDGKLEALVSFPLDQVGLPAFRGRYLNGTATLEIGFNDGLLKVVPIQVMVNGKPLPKAYLDVLRRQNLARPLNNESRASVAMNRLQNVKVEDGRLVIVAKSPE